MNQLMSLQMALRDELFSTTLMITHKWAISSLYDLNVNNSSYMRPQMSLKVAGLRELF